MLFICTKKPLHIVTAATTKTTTTTTTGKWDDFYMKYETWLWIWQRKIATTVLKQTELYFLFTLFLPEAFYLLFCCWNLKLVKRVKTGALKETLTSGKNWSGKTALLHQTFLQLTHTHNHFLMLFLSQTNGHHHHLIRMIYYFMFQLPFFLICNLRLFLLLIIFSFSSSPHTTTTTTCLTNWQLYYSFFFN